MCPVTAVAAGMASLNDAELVPRRRRELAALRGEVFNWLTRKGFPFVPSVSNCFMLDTGRPTQQVIAAMQQRGIYIGRAWPAWPTHVRITIGTAEEMRRFQSAYEQVMSTKTLSRVEPLPQRPMAAPFKPRQYRVLG
jgi:histidinol-phosphate/aromatic aminotransferase/cobyric acid decarboxylase-like protein